MTAVAELRTAPGAIPALVENLRRTFAGGRTKQRSWREAQLARLDAMLAEKKDELLSALEADLGKSAFEGWMSELAFVRKEIAHTKKQLGRWMRPEKVATPLAYQPGKSTVVREPLGVVLIIAPWNYPLQLALGAAGRRDRRRQLRGGEAVGGRAAHVGGCWRASCREYLDPECGRRGRGRGRRDHRAARAALRPHLLHRQRHRRPRGHGPPPPST